MSFNDLLGLCGDFCLYFSSVGFLVSLCDETKSGGFYLAVYMLCAIAFLLCRKVKGYLRFAPLIIMLPSFLSAGSIAAAILPIPLCILLGLRAHNNDWTAEYGRTREILKIGVCVYSVLLIFLLLSGKLLLFTQRSLPFFIAWLLISILELRLLRSSESSAVDVKFKILNCAVVLLVAAIGLVFSSDAFVNSTKALFTAVYTHLIGPLLFGLLCIIAALPAIVAYLIGLLLSLLRNEESEPLVLDPGGSAAELLGVTEVGQSPDWLKRMAIAIGIVLFVTACFFIMRKLLGRKSQESDSGSYIYRDSAPATHSGKKHHSILGSTPSDTVRSCYKRYLELCGKNKIDIDGSIASDEICAKSQFYSNSKDPSELRRLWLPARYSENVSTQEDAKKAKALVKKIKSDIAARYK